MKIRNGITRFGERPRLNKEEKEQITTLYSEGLSGSKVSRKLNIPPATVFYYIRKAGIIRSRAVAQRTRHSTNYTDEQIEEITHLYIIKHLSSRQIATKLCVSPSSVARLIQKLGIARKSALGIRLHYGERMVLTPLPPILAHRRNKLINDYHTCVHSMWLEYQERCNKPMSNAGRCQAHQNFLSQIKPDLKNLFSAIIKLRNE